MALDREGGTGNVRNRETGGGGGDSGDSSHAVLTSVRGSQERWHGPRETRASTWRLGATWSHPRMRRPSTQTFADSLSAVCVLTEPALLLRPPQVRPAPPPAPCPAAPPTHLPTSAQAPTGDLGGSRPSIPCPDNDRQGPDQHVSMPMRHKKINPCEKTRLQTHPSSGAGFPFTAVPG